MSGRGCINEKILLDLIEAFGNALVKEGPISFELGLCSLEGK
jgi:hypothetical protein